MAQGVNAQHFDTWNPNVNMYVPDAQFSADIDYLTGEYRADYGACPAINATGVLAGGNWATAGSSNVFAATLTRAALAPYGRQLSFVSLATAANVVTIQGRDYMGQPIRETLTINGATPVNSLKIYRWIELLTWTAPNGAATTVNIGWTDVFGLPYRTIAVQNWFEDGVSATAGTFVAGASNSVAQTAGSSDPRGTVDFTSASNGVRTFALIGVADLTELYGIAHFGG
jgi:hypothetical protein